ncbi:MAG: enoyl-ACP reductase FabI [Alphaproteobacteria bacterium]
MSDISIMKGKRGLIMGVANHNSIAWGIAQAMAGAGAELAFTYQGEAFGKRVKPLAAEVGSNIVLDCDVTDGDSLDAVFAAIEKEWGELDFLVHAIAYSDKSELKGRYIDTSKDNFVQSLLISCYSFTDVARRAAPLMKNGGAMLTLSYGGAQKVMPNYNVMGVAKAALEASVRYMAADLGPDNIRINAISAGPMRTLAGAVIGDSRFVFNFTETHSPLKKNVSLGDVGGSALYLLSPLSGGVTGEIHYVDAGYNTINMPRSRDLKRNDDG